MPKTRTKVSDLLDTLKAAVRKIMTPNIDIKKEISQILKFIKDKQAKSIHEDQLEKFISVTEGVAGIVPLLGSKKRLDKIICIVKIASFLSSCLSSVLGPLPAIATLILALLAKFLTYIGKGEDDITKALKEDLELKDLEHDIAGVEKQLRTSMNYLCALVDQKTTTEKDVSSMISFMDLDKGVKILGTLQSKIKIAVLQRDLVQVNKAIHFVAYYVRIAALRYSMLGQMLAIVTVTMKESGTAKAIKNVMDGEGKEDEEFLRFLTIPTLEKATFFALFDLSNFEEIEIFLQSKGLKVQNLNEDLSEKVAYIQTFSPVSGSKPFVRIANWGTVCAAKETNPKDAPLFSFFAISEKDNYFYISNARYRFMYMKSDRYCAGTYNQPGPDGKWKVIRMKDDSFILCPEKGPGNFLYMEKKLGIIGFGKLKGLNLENEISERILMENCRSGKLNLRQRYDRIFHLIDFITFLLKKNSIILSIALHVCTFQFLISLEEMSVLSAFA